MKTCEALNVPGWQGGCLREFKQVLVRAWFNVFGPRCLFCGREMKIKAKQSDLRKATIDHINARCFGGDDAPSNLQVICQRCNHSKSRAEASAIRYLG